MRERPAEPGFWLGGGSRHVTPQRNENSRCVCATTEATRLKPRALAPEPAAQGSKSSPARATCHRGRDAGVGRNAAPTHACPAPLRPPTSQRPWRGLVLTRGAAGWRIGRLRGSGQPGEQDEGMLSPSEHREKGILAAGTEQGMGSDPAGAPRPAASPRGGTGPWAAQRVGAEAMALPPWSRGTAAVLPLLGTSHEVWAKPWCVRSPGSRRRALTAAAFTGAAEKPATERERLSNTRAVKPAGSWGLF